MKRSPMPNGKPLARTSAMKRASVKPKEAKPAKGPRLKSCRVCKSKFEPRTPLAVACGVACAIEHGKKVTAAQKAKQQRQERAQDKIKREAFKSRRAWLNDCQRAFNSFVRLRDQLAGYPCISSGRPLDWSGNAVDAGHYRSVGSAPHLRFNEDNCHAQSKHDNQFKSGNAVDYRIGLIARIGLARVEALEADNTPAKWTVDDLKAIKALYVAKLRQLRG